MSKAGLKFLAILGLDQFWVENFALQSGSTAVGTSVSFARRQQHVKQGPDSKDFQSSAETKSI